MANTSYKLQRLKDNPTCSNPTYYNQWTEEEDRMLQEGIKKYGVGKWKEISKLIQTKNYFQVVRRWNYVSKKKRGRWTKEEDELLINLIKGSNKNWIEISKVLERPYTSIFKRYMRIISEPWTLEDNIKLRDSVNKFGEENWEKIMESFPNRSRYDVKQHYRNCPATNPGISLGKWNDQEIFNFLDAFKKHGKQWKYVSTAVGTRTPAQCHRFWSRHIK